MKRFWMLLVLALIPVLVFGQGGKNWTVITNAGKYTPARADSSGYIQVVDASYDAADSDTLTVTTNYTAIPLGNLPGYNYDLWEVYCDNYSTAFYFSTTYGTTPGVSNAIRLPAGSIAQLVPTNNDSCWVKVETVSGKITVNRYHWKRY